MRLVDHLLIIGCRSRRLQAVVIPSVAEIRGLRWCERPDGPVAAAIAHTQANARGTVGAQRATVVLARRAR